MSSHHTSTNQYNASSMSAYNAFQPQIQSSLLTMASNPLGSSYFQNQLAQQQQQAQQVGQRNISNIAQNARAGGNILSNSGGYMNAQIARGGIANSVMQSNSFNSAVNNALQNRNMALMSMAAYQPLQTGQTNSSGGTGTWLPQTASMAGNMLMPGIGSSLAGNGFSAGYGGSSSNPYSGASLSSNPIPQASSSMYNSMMAPTTGSMYPNAQPQY